MGRARGAAHPTMRRPFGQQVVLGIGALLLLVVSIAALAIALVVNLHGREAQVNDRDHAYVTAVQTAALDAKGIANDERGFLLTGKDEFVVEAHDRIGSVHQALADAGRSALNSPETHAVAESSRVFDAWIDQLDDVVRTYRSGDADAAVAISMGRDRELRKTYEHSLSQAESIGSMRAKLDDRSASDAASRTVYALIVGLVVCVVLGLGIGEWLLRTIVRPVEHLVELLYMENRLHTDTT